MEDADTPVRTHGPRLLAPGFVKGKPFSAQVEEVQQRKLFLGFTANKKMSGEIHRDSSGRIRQDFRLRMLGTRVLVGYIYDSPKRTLTVLDFQRRIASTSPMTVPEVSDPRIEGSGETRVIEGLLCKRIGSSVSPSGESFSAWFSEDLYHVVLEEERKRRSSRTWRLVNVRHMEPDDSLFQVPTDFSRR
jgi:hypothetical protein